MIVDDDESIRHAVQSLLLTEEIESVAASGKQECLAYLEAGFRGVILMDIMMPEMDGYDATREVRRCEEGTSKHLPIIALTGHTSEEDAQKCRQAGMDRVVTKPVTLAVLRTNLQELVRNGKS